MDHVQVNGDIGQQPEDEKGDRSPNLDPKGFVLDGARGDRRIPQSGLDRVGVGQLLELWCQLVVPHLEDLWTQSGGHVVVGGQQAGGLGFALSALPGATPSAGSAAKRSLKDCAFKGSSQFGAVVHSSQAVSTRRIALCLFLFCKRPTVCAVAMLSTKAPSTVRRFGYLHLPSTKDPPQGAASANPVATMPFAVAHWSAVSSLPQEKPASSPFSLRHAGKPSTAASICMLTFKAASI
mmetsp:Transcript_59528/g.194135  ORF Transcript_59528/g.194135 Transcript_59528/m.194135 type:complete len:237 (-) Transcript_59528:1155-1865(-)